MKVIEQIKFKLTGKHVPVYRVTEVEPGTGRVLVLQDLGVCQDNPNTLQYTWEQKGYEKIPGVPPLIRMNSKGDKEPVWVVNPSGQTVNLYTDKVQGPAKENVIGALLSVDIIAIAMALYPSMRDKVIFMVIGILLGWLIFGPMINKAMS